MRCRVMEPIVVAKEFTKESGVNDVYLFVNIPYFSLERYSGSQSGQNNRLFHTRGLMQSRHPSVTKHRELQQAVCQLPGTPPGTCFHVSSLWCLVIRDSTLFPSYLLVPRNNLFDRISYYILTITQCEGAL